MTPIISTYQNSDPITDIGEFANGSKQAKRGAVEVCLSNEPAGDWWWHLDDGCLDVGPFISEQAALIDCAASLGEFEKVQRAIEDYLAEMAKVPA